MRAAPRCLQRLCWSLAAATAAMCALNNPVAQLQRGSYHLLNYMMFSTGHQRQRATPDRTHVASDLTTVSDVQICCQALVQRPVGKMFPAGMSGCNRDEEHLWRTAPALSLRWHCRKFRKGCSETGILEMRVRFALIVCFGQSTVEKRD